MMNKKLMTIVREIIQNQSNGIRHADLVHEVLNRGITYEGKEGISAGVHSVLKSLITKGEIMRNQNDALDRNYVKSVKSFNEKRKSANMEKELVHVG